MKANPGASIPSEAMMHFLPRFRFPPIFDKFSDSVENFQNVTFPAKISDDLFAIDHKFRISPYFPCFPPVSRKLLYPTLKNSLCFRKIHLVFTYFMYISFPPYFDHDAFMHHPMHVLDAPGRIDEQLC